MFHLFQEVDRERTVVQDGFVSYDFKKGVVIDSDEETVQACNRLRGGADVPSCIHLPVVTAYLCVGVLQEAFKDVRRDYECFVVWWTYLMRP